MTSREATIYQLKKLKGQPLKKQLHYILTNFWLPIVAILAALITVISLTVHWATLKPYALTVCCINSTGDMADVDSYLHQFAAAHGIDTNEYELNTEFVHFGQSMDSDYQNAQVFAAMLMVGNLDTVSAEHERLIRYAYQGYFVDLSQVLTQEQKDALAPHLLYIDQSRLEEFQAYTGEMPVCPDPLKPEEMEQPIPVAITLQPGWSFTQAAYPYTHGKDAIALVQGSGNAENAKAFLQYILEQKGN